MYKSGYNGFEMELFEEIDIIMLLYIDDMLISGCDMQEINKLGKQFGQLV